MAGQASHHPAWPLNDQKSRGSHWLVHVLHELEKKWNKTFLIECRSDLSDWFNNEEASALPKRS